METFEKQRRLKKYKAFATGLFLLMALIFILTYILPETAATGYIRAFSEAAMVGALADWFAVTALFRHPMGIPIPHTNLIEANKNNIGSNLGGFIADNFLTPENIKPRIKALSIAPKIGEWLQQPIHQDKIIHEILNVVQDGMQQLSDSDVEKFISIQLQQIAQNAAPNELAGDFLNSFLQRKEYEQSINFLAEKAAAFILSKENLIKEKIKAESNALIPDFINDMIAVKVTKGLHSLLLEIAHDPNHSQRKQITQKLMETASEMKSEEKWKQRIGFVFDNLLSEKNSAIISGKIWSQLKNQLLLNFANEDNVIKNYLKKWLQQLADSLSGVSTQNKQLDNFIKTQAFKLVMNHRNDVAGLISNTVKNWESKSLSQKLETEVGKDLQFIRVNGTLVGGLVGLLIYIVLKLFQFA